jgi:ferredoxin-type protein NapG
MTATIAGIDRRTFCLGVGGIAVLLGLGCVKLADAKSLVRPPGGQDEQRLLSLCLRCQKCLTACPRNIIAPAHVEDGFLNMRTPLLTFSADYCDWCAEANDGVPLCVQACPVGALQLPVAAERESVVLGLANLHTDWCLAYRLAGCRYCYDACEFKAIELDSAGRPHLIIEKCTGCGACETVCVSLQNGSISAGATERAIVVRPDVVRT